MKATASTINMLEKSRPLSDEEIALINNCFKTQFANPMYAWALTAKNSKRQTLFNALRCKPAEEHEKRSYSQLSTTKASPDLVIRTALYTIDFNKSLSTPMFKHLDPRHNRSQIKEEGCFLYEKTPNVESKSPKKRSLTSIYTSQLFVNSFINKFSVVADGYIDLLKELINFTENKANICPATIKGVDSRKEYKLISSTFKEDHLNRRKIVSKSLNPISEGKTRPITSFSRYNEEYTNEPFTRVKRAKLMPPFENTRAIASFPAVQEDDMKPFLQREANASLKQNVELGRMNHNIFTSKTIL